MSRDTDRTSAGLWRVPIELSGARNTKAQHSRVGDASARPQSAPQAPLAHICSVVAALASLLTCTRRHDHVAFSATAATTTSSCAQARWAKEALPEANGAGPPLCACLACPRARERHSGGSGAGGGTERECGTKAEVRMPIRLSQKKKNPPPPKQQKTPFGQSNSREASCPGKEGCD